MVSDLGNVCPSVLMFFSRRLVFRISEMSVRVRLCFSWRALVFSHTLGTLRLCFFWSALVSFADLGNVCPSALMFFLESACFFSHFRNVALNLCFF